MRAAAGAPIDTSSIAPTCWSVKNVDDNPQLLMEEPMAWKKPRIVEIAVGLEINSYACAAVA